MNKIAANVDGLVARHVRPGMHLHFSATTARPNALINAVARVLRGRGRLTVSVASIHSNAHALALSGAVDRMITGFVGDTYPSPRPNPLYANLAAGEPFQARMWSLLSLAQRLMAGALGQPYAVTSSLTGSDLATDLGDEVRPLSEGALIPALRPDLTLVHGVCADVHGNVVLCPPYGEGAWAAYAAQGGVLASVERIVPRVDADDVVIPAQRVVGLCEAPLGAHPQSLRTNDIEGIAGYPDDYGFMTEIVRRCAEPGGADRWFAEWVDLPGGHDEYVAKVRVRPVTEPRLVAPTEITPAERMIVLAARAIAEQVRTRGYDTLMAGIGASHLATWLAEAVLRAEGHEVQVVTELGFIGMRPSPGDVFLFSQRHVAHTTQLAGIPEVLGGMVAANGRCLGVLSAAEVGENGDVNTSKLAGGRWLTGSGGANDVASTSDFIVVCAATPRRYVPEVAYVTSPGGRAREVVSQFGRFRRDGEGFELASWFTDAGEPQSLVDECTGWTAHVDRAVPEPEVTPGELALLRALDPEGHYR